MKQSWLKRGISARAAAWPLLAAGVLIAGLLSSGPVAASASLPSFSGEVVGVTKDAIRVRGGGKVLEFDRSGPGRASLAKVRKGDRVTLRYRREPVDVSVQPSPPAQGEMPGKTAPGHAPGVTPSPDPNEPGTTDDRAFYNARNEGAPRAGASGRPAGT